MYFALSLSDKEILSKLLEPNTESAEEDAAGMIRWLRSEYQNRMGRVDCLLSGRGIESKECYEELLWLFCQALDSSTAKAERMYIE